MLCASDQLGRDMLVRPATEVEGGNCDTCAESAQHRRWLRTLHDDYNERLSRASLTSSNGSEACTFESDRELSDDDDKGALCRQAHAVLCSTVLGHGPLRSFAARYAASRPGYRASATACSHCSSYILCLKLLCERMALQVFIL